MSVVWLVFQTRENLELNSASVVRVVQTYIVNILLLYVVIHADLPASILSAIMPLKSSLAYFIEPDFELLDHLLRLHVLNLRQLASVRRKETVYDRNDALLDLLTSEDHCVKFLHALQLTGQQHVVNFIKQNGGEKQTS